jgi:hypothetical protein
MMVKPPLMLNTLLMLLLVMLKSPKLGIIMKDILLLTN